MVVTCAALGPRPRSTILESRMTALDRRKFTRSLLAVPAAALVGTGLGALAPAAASAAAGWETQFLAGQANGELKHRWRRVNGSDGPAWDPVDTPGGTLYRVSCVGVAEDLHVVATLNSGTPDYGVRHGADDSWTEFTPIPSLGGPTAGAVHVAVTALDGELHIFGADEGGTTLYHTVRGVQGAWQLRWKALRNFGRITQIATTRVGTTIDTAVVADGKLLHAIRKADGTWTGWGNIESAAGDIENLLHVALAGIGSQLHVLAVNGSGEVYHAVRRVDATWRQFRRVSVFDQYPTFVVSAANVGGELQVGAIHRHPAGGQGVRYSIRGSDGTWELARTLSGSGFTDEPGALAMTGTTVA
jgi:hypothetical protein